MAHTRREILGGMATLCVSPSLAMVQPTAKKKNRSALDSTNLRASLTQVLGLMPHRPAPEYKTLESTKLDAGWRHKIEFIAEPPDPLFDAPQDVIRAYLFVPNQATKQPTSAIVAIHQDGPQSHIGKSEPAGLAGDKNLHYGLELFGRGYVVICPDRFGHAERRRVTPNDITSIDADRDDGLLNHRVGQLLLRGRTAFGKETYDLMVATDVLMTLDYVDKGRIGAIGHSAGGHNLVFFMFGDSRIRAGVSSCGLFSILHFYSESAAKKRLAAFALPGLASVGDSADYLGLLSPRPVLLTRGLWEWGQTGDDATFSKKHVEETRETEAHARTFYERDSASQNLQTIYFDENGGNHDFPPNVREQTYAWLDQNLKHTPPSKTPLAGYRG